MLTILWHVFCNELNATKTQLRNGFSTTWAKRKARSRHKKCWGKRSSEACLLLKEALLSKHTECTNRQGGPGFFFFPWYSDTLVAKALAVQGITWILWILSDIAFLHYFFFAPSSQRCLSIHVYLLMGGDLWTCRGHTYAWCQLWRGSELPFMLSIALILPVVVFTCCIYQAGEKAIKTNLF